MNGRTGFSVATWLVVFVLAVACSPQADNPVENEPGPAGPDPEDEATEASVAPLPRSNVEIYFPSALESGLVGEFREIFDTSTPGDRAKQIVADLISGPTTEEALRALPPGARLRQVYVLSDGTAYLDFSTELTMGVTGGSMTEMLSVYAIVNSVVLNVPEIRRVAILVNGRSMETLNGHMDLSRPLVANDSLILGSIITRSPRAIDSDATWILAKAAE